MKQMGAGLFSQSKNQGLPSSSQSQEKPQAYWSLSQEIKLYAHPPCFSNPAPFRPLTNQITHDPLPLYLSNLLVSIISNLQRNTLVYKKVFCINNYYFQTLQMKPGHNLKFHESYNFKCEAIQMKKKTKNIYIYLTLIFEWGTKKPRIENV